MERAGGIIMPIFSLNGDGIGTFGKEAYDFVDFLKRAHQKYWQVLPIGPTSCGNSPYSSMSTFAGNPNLINTDEFEKVRSSDNGHIDYDKIIDRKTKILKKAFEDNFDKVKDEVLLFAEDNSSWIYDYTLYMALKEYFDFKPWYEWPQDIRLKREDAVKKYSSELENDISFHMYLQYLFFKQWNELKEYAHNNGVRIIGDLPIYVAMDSADVWVEPESFMLDEKNMPIEVAGVPPDYFSKEGQLWGNPLYNWERMKDDGYGWWIRRIDGARKLFDVIRIDHFRGLESYWAVPSSEKTAVNGHWVKGPGIEFINLIKGWFGTIDIIAEDLGILTDDVRLLLKQSGFPGMKVLQFAFDESGNSDYLPHKYERNCVCYTGTHDNATLTEWKSDGDAEEISFAKEYFGIGADDNFNFGIIRGGMASVADLFMVQLQDYLELDGQARTNIPGVPDGNWEWKMKNGLSAELADKIAKMTIMYGRG